MTDFTKETKLSKDSDIVSASESDSSDFIRTPGYQKQKQKLIRILEDHEEGMIFTLFNYVLDDVKYEKKVLNFHFPNMASFICTMENKPSKVGGTICVLEEKEVRKVRDYLPHTRVRLETENSVGILLSADLLVLQPSGKMERRRLIHYYVGLNSNDYKNPPY